MIIDRPQLLETLHFICLHAAKRKLELTLDEARCILDACNGLFLTREILGQHLRLEVADAIRLNAIDEKWRIDGRALVGKLRDLPRALSSAVEIWIADFWASDQLDDSEWERSHLALITNMA